VSAKHRGERILPSGRGERIEPGSPATRRAHRGELIHSSGRGEILEPTPAEAPPETPHPRFEAQLAAGRRRKPRHRQPGESVLLTRGNGELIDPDERSPRRRGERITRGNGLLLTRGNGELLVPGATTTKNRGELITRGNGTLIDPDAPVTRRRHGGELITRGDGELIEPLKPGERRKHRGEAIVPTGRGELIARGNGILLVAGQEPERHPRYGERLRPLRPGEKKKHRGVAIVPSGCGEIMEPGRRPTKPKHRGELITRGNGLLIEPGPIRATQRPGPELITRGNGELLLPGATTTRTRGELIARGNGEMIEPPKPGERRKHHGEALVAGRRPQRVPHRGELLRPGSTATSNRGEVLRPGATTTDNRGAIIPRGGGELITSLRHGERRKHRGVPINADERIVEPRGIGELLLPGSTATSNRGEILRPGGATTKRRGELITRGNGTLIERGNGQLIQPIGRGERLVPGRDALRPGKPAPDPRLRHAGERIEPGSPLPRGNGELLLSRDELEARGEPEQPSGAVAVIRPRNRAGRKGERILRGGGDLITPSSRGLVMSNGPDDQRGSAPRRHRGEVLGDGRSSDEMNRDRTTCGPGTGPRRSAREAGDSSSVETKRFGLNFLRDMGFEQPATSPVIYDWRVGHFGASLEDAGRNGLGAQVVRQLGGRDLFWGALVPTQDIGPNLGLGYQVERQGPHALYDYDNVESLAHQFELARENGVKLIYTFLDQTGDIDAPPADPPPAPELRVLRDGEAFFHTVDPRDRSLSTRCQLVGPCANLDWSGLHLDRADWSGGVPARFPVITTSSTTGRLPSIPRGSAAEWHMQALDLSSGYKQALVEQIAERVGTMLQDAYRRWRFQVAESPQVGGIDQVVDAIEIFNEIDDKVVYLNADGDYDPDLSAYFVGQAYARVAYVLRAALDAIPGGENVRLLLPSVSSYSDVTDAPNKGWESHRDFVRGVVKYAVQYLTDARFLGESVSDLTGYVQGIDYHFYHVVADDLRHIAYLPLEVEELRRAVWDGVNDSVEDLELEYPLVSAHLANEFPVSVLESGTSGFERNPVVVFPSFVPGTIDAETYQAHEVWRRLGGALASDAGIAGWHAWMSGSERTLWQGFGLRDDVTLATGTPFDAASSIPRQSWGAYQRVTQLLDGVVTGRVVLPTASSRASLDSQISVWNALGAAAGASPGFVVMEYQLQSGTSGRRTSWAYLVLYDPTLADDSRYELWARWTFMSGLAEQVDTTVGVVGESRSVRVLIPGAGMQYTLPSAVFSAATRTVVYPRTSFRPRGADDPILILSSERISWALQPA